MGEEEWLAERFDAHRHHLRGVAYRMLGSMSEADDAVQEAWLRLSRSDASVVENMGGWLTTVVARICLDTLRSRKSRREISFEGHKVKWAASRQDANNPEQEMLLADSVGLALLVVLELLPPAERVAFVLHDMFDLPFDEIAPIVGRSATAARQLASRARRRVRGGTTPPEADLAHRREVVEAFSAASRDGDFDALLALLDRDVVLRADRTAASSDNAREVRGALAVARQALAFSGRSRFAEPALIDGAVGLLVAPGGRLLLVLRFRITRGKIAEIEVIVDPEHLNRLHLAVLNN